MRQIAPNKNKIVQNQVNLTNYFKIAIFVVAISVSKATLSYLSLKFSNFDLDI